MGSRETLWEDVDRMDAEAWSRHLAPDAVMRFGNADPVHGREACRDALAGFYDQIGGLSHEIVNRSEDGNVTIWELTVTYTRTDGRDVTVPAVTIYRTNDDDLIADYRIFVDQAPLWAD